jgi:hypothetical protein
LSTCGRGGRKRRRPLAEDLRRGGSCVRPSDGRRTAAYLAWTASSSSRLSNRR